jgi:hypothetical protein
MTPRLKTAALFQVSSVALFASPVAGSAVALACIAVHLLFIHRTWSEALTVGVFALGGGVVETVLMRLGFVHFATPATFDGLCPLWIAVFWGALGTLASGPLHLLRERRALALGAGFVLAPLSFIGSEQLGALTLTRPLPGTLAAIAMVMAAALVLMFEAARSR